MKILIACLIIICSLVFVNYSYSCSCKALDTEQQITKKCKSTKIKRESIVQKYGLPISEEIAKDIAQAFSIFPHEIADMIVQYLPDEKESVVRKFDVTVCPQEKRSSWKVYDGNVRALRFINGNCCLMAELADKTVMAWRISGGDLVFEKNRPWLLRRYHLSIELPQFIPDSAPVIEDEDCKAEVIDYAHPNDRGFCEISGKTVDLKVNAKAVISRIIARKKISKFIPTT